jgi:TonB-linked SusC/RagA family outer membrane protein
MKTFRIMRITLFLLLVSILQTFANDTYSQKTKLSIDFSGTKLEDALDEIEDLTEFYFLYNQKLVDTDREVTLSVENKKIEDILDKLFSDTDVVYIITDRKIILIPSYLHENQQQRTLTGTITDESGQPLPGVTIAIKGTTQGTITNTDGNYSLSNVPSGATLVFSFVGMRTQEIAVGNQTSINITMEYDAIGLEEVVSIGYGIMKKRDLTGSVVSADIEAFRESPNISIVQSLQGSVPGLDIGQTSSAGQDPSILIRGKNTFSGGNSPLIVLDGIVYHGSLVDINPADIESVDVLKDASSAAVYGSKAAGGVIIITTKEGEAYGKPIFNYSGHYTLQTPSNIPKMQNREGYLNKMRDVYWEDGFLAPDYTQPNPAFDPTDYWTSDPLVEGYESGTEFDWLDAGTQPAYIQEHNISMRGKSEMTSYFISAGYSDQHGFVINDKYKRNTVRINLENKILDWFKIGVQAFVSSSDFSGQVPLLVNLIAMPPIITPYDEDGKLVKNPSGGPATNPFFENSVDDLDKRLNLMGNFYADINIPFIEGLSYRVNYSHNNLADHNYYFSEYKSDYQGYSYKYNSTRYSWTLDNILTYSRDINKHGINITLMAGREEMEFENTQAEASKFVSTELIYNKLDVGGVPRVYSGGWDESSLYYMGRFHYDYSNKYLASFTIRRDGFSGFSKENKFAIFPSAALAWVASEENFLKDNQDFINFLKIRTSYGENGNASLGRYGTLSRVEAGQGYVFGDGSYPYITQRIERLGNSDLHWETTTSFNLGIDFVLLNQRIRGNVEYYNSDTRDILYQVSIPQITGYNSIPTNIGKIHNQGIEFSITGIIIKKPDFAWDMTFNYWRNRNEIRSIIGLDDDGDGIEDDLIADNMFIGEPLGVIYNFVKDGLYQVGDSDIPDGWHPGQHRFKDLNGDGEISMDHDRKIIGYTDPAYRFSINNHFQYKNWSLRVFINSVQGGDKYYYGSNYPNSNYGENAAHNGGFVWDWWTPSNPDAEYPQLYYKTPVSPTYRVSSQRSFVRLQDVSLSYTFGKSFINQIGINNLKVYFSGKNLLTLTEWQGWDPETGLGLNRSGMPTMAGYTFGLDFSF